jgi:anti-sigma B factor antagonist
VNPEPAWQHQVRADGDRATVVLSGEIDMRGAAQLQDLLLATVHAHDTVEVDIAAVAFVDSTVISALITARNTATTAGRRLALLNPSDRVRRVLAVTGVLDILTADVR